MANRDSTHAPVRLREALEQGDVDGILETLAADAVLYSPAAASLKFSGHTELRMLFEATTAAYQDLVVRHDFGNETEWVIGIQARIASQQFEETLMLSINDDGKIAELRPAIRPMAGVAVVANEIGSRLARRQGLGRSLAMRLLGAPLAQMAKSGEGIGPRLIGLAKPTDR